MPSLPVLNPATDAAPGWSETDRAETARALANAIEGEVRFGLHDRMLYATDASLYQVEPLGVVIPASVDDAARAARWCLARGLPLLPRGGGTSLAGQCTNRAVVLDLSANCRGVGPVDPVNRTVGVEPGVYVEELNAELSRRGTGLFFAPDPATVRQATIGGCIGNNAAGARSILFGRTSENLESVDALLAGGERVTLGPGAALHDPRVRDLTERVAAIVTRHAALIRERFPRTIRRNAGYGLDLVLQMLEGRGAYSGGSGIGNVNLAHLLAGSEGTLAVTLGARVRLRRVPAAKGLAVLAFATLDEAIDAVLPILETRPSAVELLDDLVISLARENAVARRQVELLPTIPGATVNAVLYVEYFADAADELPARFAALRAAVPRAAFAAYTGAAEMLQAWRLRQSGEPLLHGLPGERKPITFVEDNAIPVERLAEFVKTLRGILAGHGTRGAFYAHASVGVLHVRPLLSIKDPDDLALLRTIAVETADLARSLGGVMSGEHGDGRVRGPLLERFFGPELMAAFREIKAVFDPRGLLNPGMIVAPGPIQSITARMRVDPAPPTAPGDDHHRHDPSPSAVRVPDVPTFFEFADQHGLAGAVEMCNGAGVCRKRSGGTMCPSYMALQDERHATRGRANALRLAVTGQFSRDGRGEPAWNDPDTLDTLDLCLSCKACKAECPSNVDVARLKSEYLAQGHKQRGEPPLSALITAHVRTLNRLGSLTPGLANAVNALPPVRALISRVMDVHPRRSLPRFAPSLSGWFSRRRRRASAGAPRVALFADCFTAYNEPEIGKAAVRLLEWFGYEVVLPRSGCCARPAISTGVLDRARTIVDGTLADLRAVIDDPGVRAIVVCEPSCLSSFKDDWLDLRLDTPKDVRRRLAAKAWLVEEFLERAWDEHPARPSEAALDTIRRSAPSVILHAHCHQKALWGADSSAAFLRRLVGTRLSVLDTGCCGMAGSFGFGRERFDLSNRIGELGFFPAIRAASPGAVVVATGTSCRHQAHDGVGVTPAHPVQLAADLLLRTAPALV